MNFLIFGLLISIGFGVGKILTDVLSEIVFSRLHDMHIYKVICKKVDYVKSDKSKKRGKIPIGFHVDDVE